MRPAGARLLLCAWLSAGVALSGCVTDAASTQPGALRNAENTNWQPGNYLELYTQPKPATANASPAQAIRAQRWQPGNYLELYTQPKPATANASPAQAIRAQRWQPGNYLELYTR